MAGEFVPILRYKQPYITRYTTFFVPWLETNYPTQNVNLFSQRALTRSETKKMLNRYEQIIAINVDETDAAASQYFSTIIQTWKDARSYPGLELEDLPEGTKEIDRIVVSLEDNCRGIH